MDPHQIVLVIVMDVAASISPDQHLDLLLHVQLVVVLLFLNVEDLIVSLYLLRC